LYLLAGPLAALMVLVLGNFADTRWIVTFFSSDNSPLVTGILNAPAAGSNATDAKGATAPFHEKSQRSD